MILDVEAGGASLIFGGGAQGLYVFVLYSGSISLVSPVIHVFVFFGYCIVAESLL